MNRTKYEIAGSTAILTISRPECHNAVDGRAAGEIRLAIEQFEADPNARVMVLTGEGEAAFCAGADLKAIRTLDMEHPDGPMGATRRTVTKPMIAAVSGWCLAGGLELALWCDLRIAGQNAQFGFPERRWGVPLIDGGTQRLPRVIGLGRALDLILTGRIVGCEEAVSMGLVTEMVETGTHLDRALKIAETLATFPQETMLSDRRAAIEGFGLPIAQGLDLERRYGMEVLAHAVEGADRFAGGAGRHGRPDAPPAKGSARRPLKNPVNGRTPRNGLN